jgi:hypothetical protein
LEVAIEHDLYTNIRDVDLRIKFEMLRVKVTSIPACRKNLCAEKTFENHSLRALTGDEEDTLVDCLHRSKPSLKANIENLSTLLLQLIEQQYLPDRKLMLKKWSESEIRSGEHASRSLKDLFEYSDEKDYTSFLTSQATPGFSPPDTELSPQSFDDSEEADDSIALLEPRILDLTDPCIVYSDLVGDRKEMDNFGEDFFSLSM